MQITLHHSHPWNLSPQDAVRLQQELAACIIIAPIKVDIKYVTGVDVGFRNGQAVAAAVLLEFPSLQIIEEVTAEVRVEFPYVPGLLSFREIPAILQALNKLNHLPDLIMVDGQGIAHPRRFGLAAHLGLLLDIPSIGCAKSVLVGKYAQLDAIPGSTSKLLDHDEVIGAALRTRHNSKPVIISIGHRVDLESAMSMTIACGRGYRLPEPTRLAHNLASRKEPASP